MIFGFLGYNQVMVKEFKQPKIVIAMAWDTFIYVKIPFELKNVEAMFQRAMDVAFDGLINENGDMLALFYCLIKGFK